MDVPRRPIRLCSIGPREPQGAMIEEGTEYTRLLAGKNFGSGSSREHAPWALLAFGFRAIPSTSFADIGGGNSLKNSLLPVVVPPETHAELFRLVERDPDAAVTIDLASQTLTLPGGHAVNFPLITSPSSVCWQG